MAYIKDSGNISGGIKPSSSLPKPKPPAPPKKDNPYTGVDTGSGGNLANNNQPSNKQPEYNYNPYEDYMDEINRQRRREEEARRNAIDAGVGQLQSQIPLLERQRDEASRQAYMRSQQAQVNMPQQLAAMGSTGGLSESSIMQANAGYQNTQNELTNAYQDALAGVNGDIANLKSSGELSIVDNSGKYYQQLLDLAARQAQEAQSRRYTAGDVQTGDIQPPENVPIAARANSNVADYYKNYSDTPITPSPGVPSMGGFYYTSVASNVEGLLGAGKQQEAVNAIMNAYNRGMLTQEQVAGIRAKYRL